MSAINMDTLPNMTGESKKLAKASPASSGLIPVGETSFVFELATVSDHADLDHAMRGTPQIVDVDLDVIMVDAPDVEVELGVPELDSAEVYVPIVEDLDTVMENAPLAELEVKPVVAELSGEDIIIDYS